MAPRGATGHSLHGVCTVHFQSCYPHEWQANRSTWCPAPYCIQTQRIACHALHTAQIPRGLTQRVTQKVRTPLHSVAATHRHRFSPAARIELAADDKLVVQPVRCSTLSHFMDATRVTRGTVTNRWSQLLYEMKQSESVVA